MLINLKSMSPVPVMICSMSVFCTYLQPFALHTIRANKGKITFFLGGGYSSLTLSFEGNPRTQGHEILSRSLGQSTVKIS